MKKQIKKKIKRKNGITLIALVVTIIVLLILAGISIGMLSGDNSIIKQAGNAKTQTNIAEEKEILEQATVIAMGKNKYGNIEKMYLDEELNKILGNDMYSSKSEKKGIKVTFISSNRSYLIDADGNIEIKDDIKLPEGLKVGSIVTYDPDGSTYNWQAEYASSDLTPENDDVVLDSTSTGDYRITNWIVFSIDEEEGEIQLVPNILPTGEVRLQGAQGYNNGVKLLNDACSKLYSYEAKEISARNINIEDIEKIYDNDILENAKVNVNSQFARSYTSKDYYPLIYEKEIKSAINGNINTTGLKVSDSETKLIKREDLTTLELNQVSNEKGKAIDGYLKAKTSIQPFMIKYEISFLHSNYYKEYGNIYSSIFNKKFWIASRCFSVLNGDNCYFAMRCSNAGILSSSSLFWSGCDSYESNNALFPIVSVNANLIVVDESNFKVNL